MALLWSPPVQGGGGPYDNDAPFGMPENNQSGDEPVPTSSVASSTPIVADVSARLASAEIAAVDDASARLRIIGASVAAIGDATDVEELEDQGLDPAVLKVEDGEKAVLESTEFGTDVTGAFRVLPGAAHLELAPGTAGDLHTAYVVLGPPGAIGDLVAVERIVPLPLWGTVGVDLQQIDAAAEQVASLRDLGVMVVLTSTTFDLVTGQTSFSIDASARWVVGELEEGARVSTHGL
ncbi:MAG: hypothetical protein ACF8XB_22130 [Planctomycetota bacterium JB042]